jgi:hypothetical protein
MQKATRQRRLGGRQKSKQKQEQWNSSSKRNTHHGKADKQNARANEGKQKAKATQTK